MNGDILRDDRPLGQEQDAPEAGREAFYRERLDGSDVPDHLREGLINYLAHYRRPGSFLQSVLENDLLNAAKRGDHESREHLSVIVLWLYAHAEIDAWGSPANVAVWLASRTS